MEQYTKLCADTFSPGNDGKEIFNFAIFNSALQMLQTKLKSNS